MLKNVLKKILVEMAYSERDGSSMMYSNKARTASGV